MGIKKISTNNDFFIEDKRYKYQKRLFIKFEKKKAVCTWFFSNH